MKVSVLFPFSIAGEYRIKGLCLWALVMLSAGCAQFSRTEPSAAAPEILAAKTLIANLKNHNQDLKTFKGIGSVRLKAGGRLQTFRMAWMGEYPEKIRMEALSVAGQPMASLAGDGDWLTYLSHTDGRFYRKRYDAGFDALMSIPMDPLTMIALLSGRIPIIEHDESRLDQNQAFDGYILNLKKRWQAAGEKIYLNPAKERVLQIEYFDFFGTFLYRVKRDDFRNIGDFEFPFGMIAQDQDGPFFELRVDRCWANIPVDSKKFRIDPKSG